jgi:hypothetical protein
VELQRRVERAEIGRIARQHDLPESSRAQRNMTVDNVARACLCQEEPDEPSVFIVERHDVDVGEP